MSNNETKGKKRTRKTKQQLLEFYKSKVETIEKQIEKKNSDIIKSYKEIIGEWIIKAIAKKPEDVLSELDKISDIADINPPAVKLDVLLDIFQSKRKPSGSDHPGAA